MELNVAYKRHQLLYISAFFFSCRMPVSCYQDIRLDRRLQVPSVTYQALSQNDMSPEGYRVSGLPRKACFGKFRHVYPLPEYVYIMSRGSSSATSASY